MSDHLRELLAKARAAPPTAVQEDRQRVSFVYGTLKIEDDGVSREQVERVSRDIRERDRADAEARQTAG